MGRTIGVVMTANIVAGFIENHQLTGELLRYPDDPEETHGLIELPTDPLCEVICERISALKPADAKLDAIGIAMPGIVRNGVVEDSPNLAQLKGARIRDKVSATLRERSITAP